MKSKPFIKVVSSPEPSVTITQDGVSVDVTQAVISLDIHVDGQSDWSRIVLDARAEVDFPMDVQVVAPPGSILDGLKSEDLNAVIAMAGMSETPGEAVLAHLRSRLQGM